MQGIHRELGLDMSAKKCHLLITALARTRGTIRNCFTPGSVKDFDRLSYCTMLYHLYWPTQSQCDRFVEMTGFELKDMSTSIAHTNSEESP
jgi:hypothetical protein